MQQTLIRWTKTVESVALIGRMAENGVSVSEKNPGKNVNGKLRRDTRLRINFDYRKKMRKKKSGRTRCAARAGAPFVAFRFQSVNRLVQIYWSWLSLTFLSPPSIKGGTNKTTALTKR